MNDTELKTVISQQAHDDFLVLARNSGFNSKSEYLRYIVEERLYGHFSQLKHNPKGINSEWRSQG
ncbi:MAG: hypothetical protein GY694_10400 [Gammaproteobacteria bacterium]|nr:hypothetical protein [Gammaproteobacteria bacterium]MCP3899550.1 hypothetical protein [Desulfobacteraceae bacterium]